jgi:hypothetical protein
MERFGHYFISENNKNKANDYINGCSGQNFSISISPPPFPSPFDAVQYESRVEFNIKVLNTKRITFIFGEIISY